MGNVVTTTEGLTPMQICTYALQPYAFYAPHVYRRLVHNARLLMSATTQANAQPFIDMLLDDIGAFQRAIPTPLPQISQLSHVVSNYTVIV